MQITNKNAAMMTPDHRIFPQCQQSFPEELLLKIGCELDFKTLSNAFSINQTWKRILNDDWTIWKIYCSNLGIKKRLRNKTWKETFKEKTLIIRILKLRPVIMGNVRKAKDILAEYLCEYNHLAYQKGLRPPPAMFGSQETIKFCQVKIQNGLKFIEDMLESDLILSRANLKTTIQKVHKIYSESARLIGISVDDEINLDFLSQSAGKSLILAQEINNTCFLTRMPFSMLSRFFLQHYENAYEMENNDFKKIYKKNGINFLVVEFLA